MVSSFVKYRTNDNENKKSNSHSDNNIDKDQKSKRLGNVQEIKKRVKHFSCAKVLIAKSIFDVVSSMKNEKRDVTASNIITRADHFKEKATQVNDNLLKICMKRNIY